MPDTDILTPQGKPVLYSNEWELVSFTNGFYKPNRSFRLYMTVTLTLVIKGTGMNRADAVAIKLAEGYHNFLCDEIIEAGSDALNNVYALF